MTNPETLRITVARTTERGWPSWRLERGPLALTLVPQVGGRIMGMAWHGQELFFAHPELRGPVEPVLQEPDVAAVKRRLGFPLWGGNKTWLAPQDRWAGGAPFVDLDSGPYTLDLEESASGVEARMSSAICRETGVQIVRTIRMDAGGSGWTITHELRNRSSAPVEWAPWSVSMVLEKGTVFLPRRGDSQFPDGVKTFEAEGESPAIRPEVVRILGDLAVVTCRGSRAFKFGVDSDQGWMLAVIEGSQGRLVGFRKQVPVRPGAPYAHGCVCEVYNSDRFPYFEMEVHGPMVRLEPGQAFALEERQALCDLPELPENESEVRRLVPPRPEWSSFSPPRAPVKALSDPPPRVPRDQ